MSAKCELGLRKFVFLKCREIFCALARGAKTFGSLGSLQPNIREASGQCLVVGVRED